LWLKSSCLPLVTYHDYLNLNRSQCLIMFSSLPYLLCSLFFAFQKTLLIFFFSFHFPLSKIYLVWLSLLLNKFTWVALFMALWKLHNIVLISMYDVLCYCQNKKKNPCIMLTCPFFLLLPCLFILICFLLVDSMQVFGFNMKHRHIIEVSGS
jgi:hypothetical protein